MRRLTEPSHLDLSGLQKPIIIACGSERVKLKCFVVSYREIPFHTWHLFSYYVLSYILSVTWFHVLLGFGIFWESSLQIFLLPAPGMVKAWDVPIYLIVTQESNFFLQEYPSLCEWRHPFSTQTDHLWRSTYSLYTRFFFLCEWITASPK